MCFARTTATIIACSLVGTAAAPLALADGKSAPIVYAGKGPQPTGERTSQAVPVAIVPQNPSANPGKRIEFRYPDQPAVAYSEAGARTVTDDTPIAFSSSEAAISTNVARQYSQTATVTPTAASVQPATSSYERAGTPVRPVSGPTSDEVGQASWYGEAFHGKPTANGEIFDMDAMTAAHPSLPLPSLVQVVNLDNDREAVVRVNDRGPFIDGRILDVSKRAADVLGFRDNGTANVRVRYLGPAPIEVKGLAPVAQPKPAPMREISASEPYVPAQAVKASPAPQATYRPAGHGGHFVQLGSFSNIANAERLKSSLSADLPVKVQSARVNGADFFRVLVGPVGSKTDAAAMRDELARRGLGRGLVVTGGQ